jgi:hypothetical protein
VHRFLAHPVISQVLLVAGPLAAQTPTALVKSPPPIIAQQLVNQFVRAHPELTGLELAVTTSGHCKTIAATAAEDIGEKCDADELGPIRTGKPDVEAPTKADPVYDITQALHDAAGHLIGAVGMDLKPRHGADT